MDGLSEWSIEKTGSFTRDDLIVRDSSRTEKISGEQIQHVAKLGLGLADPDKISINDEGVDNIDDIKAEWV